MSRRSRKAQSQTFAESIKSRVHSNIYQAFGSYENVGDEREDARRKQNVQEVDQKSVPSDKAYGLVPYAVQTFEQRPALAVKNGGKERSQEEVGKIRDH